MGEPLFGTDGFRGQVDESHGTGINPETFNRLAYEFMGLVREQEDERPIVIVGSDTRLSSPILRQAAADGAALAGAEVWELDVAPTPTIAKMARETGAYAIAITASHNPWSDNGIKLFSLGGRKASKEIQTEVEKRYYASSGWTRLPASDKYSRRTRYDLIDKYVDLVVDEIGPGSLDGMSVIVDGAYGAVWNTAPKIYRKLGAAAVYEVACINDGANINNGYGAAHLEGVQAFIKENPKISRADKMIAAFVSDGDGDRVLAVTPEGLVIDGNHFMLRLAIGQVGIVGTIYTNFALRKAVEAMGVKFFECDNGDSCVTAKLRELTDLYGAGYTCGGEVTGHLIRTSWLDNGDGLYMGAWLASQVTQEGITLKDLYDELPLFPEKMVNVRGDNVRSALDHDRFQEVLRAEQEALGEEGKIIVRRSGTEQLVRVHAQAKNAANVEAITRRLTEALLTGA
jgi:phosphoglucosamine mutase